MVAIAHQEVRKAFPSATSTGARRFVVKTAIVLGASTNVGKSLAGLLAREGADVVGHYNSASKKDQAEKAAAAVRGHDQQAPTFQANLPKPLQAMALLDAAIAKFGKVGILINTSGKIIRTPLAEFEEAEFDELFNVNAKVPRCLSAAVDALSDGTLLAEGKKWTGFTDKEEEVLNKAFGMKLNDYTIESEAAKLTGTGFLSGPANEPFAIRDGRLITGQQQYNSGITARLVLEALDEL